MRTARLVFFLAVALVCVPGAAWPQGVPLGPEFRVNTYTTKEQGSPSIASDASGNFVVVWESRDQDSPGFDVFGQRYASSGAPLGSEFRVNTYTTYYQSAASVAADASGNFVVVWSSEQDGAGKGIFGQRYASSGAPLGPEFRVNTYTPDEQNFPSIASDTSGNLVVVWESYAQDGSGLGVFGQRYAVSGIPLGSEFRVNTYTTYSQARAAVAADGLGNFVVVWQSYAQDGAAYGVFGQRYASSGAPLGPEFRVNTSTFDQQRFPSVAADAFGKFVVVWGSQGFGIAGQRYASSGAPLGPEFRINTYITGNQFLSSVTADASGNFVVVWGNDVEDGGTYGIFGQRYASSGTALGPEFRVNTYTTNFQRDPAVASDTSGSFVVVWESYGQDGEDVGVFGQRYGQIVPVELLRFGVE